MSDVSGSSAIGLLATEPHLSFVPWQAHGQAEAQALKLPILVLAHSRLQSCGPDSVLHIRWQACEHRLTIQHWVSEQPRCLVGVRMPAPGLRGIKSSCPPSPRICTPPRCTHGSQQVVVPAMQQNTYALVITGP